MMRVLLINIDSKKAPNIALKKIELYHRNRGDEIFFDFPLSANIVDRIYVSCIFSWNIAEALQWRTYKNSLIGGTGYDLMIKLPKEIDNMKPKINYGFTTRGCPKKCHFCVVPKKEGKIKVIGDIFDLWDGESKVITLLDNNILAVPNHFKKVCSQLIDNDLKVDFQQGLDMDYLTPLAIQLLKTLKHKEYKFAWDNDDFSKKRLRTINNIYDWFGKCQFYVLAGDLPFKMTLKKLQILKKMGHNGYLMRLFTVMKDPLYITLAQWVNQKWTFHKYSFVEFCRLKRGNSFIDKISEDLNLK